MFESGRYFIVDYAFLVLFGGGLGGKSLLCVPPKGGAAERTARPTEDAIIFRGRVKLFGAVRLAMVEMVANR